MQSVTNHIFQELFLPADLLYLSRHRPDPLRLQMGTLGWVRRWDLRLARGNARITREVMGILKKEVFNLVEIRMGGCTSSRDGVALVWAEGWRISTQTKAEEALVQVDHRL
jgi:hypothetical protein